MGINEAVIGGTGVLTGIITWFSSFVDNHPFFTIILFCIGIWAFWKVKQVMNDEMDGYDKGEGGFG